MTPRGGSFLVGAASSQVTCMPPRNMMGRNVMTKPYTNSFSNGVGATASQVTCMTPRNIMGRNVMTTSYMDSFSSGESTTSIRTMAELSNSFDHQGICMTPRSKMGADINAPCAGSNGFKSMPVKPAPLQTGAATLTGVKPGTAHWVNQDSYLEKHLRDGLVLIGVFDGHGPNGTQVSNQVKNLFAETADFLASSKDVDIRGAFQKAFAHVEKRLEATVSSCEHSGATTTLALVDVVAQKVSIAHVGDSTALLITPSGGIAYQSNDHKASAHSEAARLRAHGARIVDDRLVFGEQSQYSFAMARAMGDTGLTRYGVTSKPEISCNLQFEPGCTLIIASDGVWDAIAKDAAASMVLAANPQEAANRIVRESQAGWRFAGGYIDDITALILKLPSEAGGSNVNTLSPVSKMQRCQSFRLPSMSTMSPLTGGFESPSKLGQNSPVFSFPSSM